MRGHLARHYFDTVHDIIQAAVDDDLPELERAVQSRDRSAKLPGSLASIFLDLGLVA